MTLGVGRLVASGARVLVGAGVRVGVDVSVDVSVDVCCCITALAQAGQHGSVASTIVAPALAINVSAIASAVALYLKFRLCSKRWLTVIIICIFPLFGI